MTSSIKPEVHNISLALYDACVALNYAQARCVACDACVAFVWKPRLSGATTARTTNWMMSVDDVRI